MNKTGPIIIIEDDLDDQEVLNEIFKKLNYPNKVLFFADGEEALAHINESQNLPFLILSDINMPKLNGFDLRQKLKTDAKLNVKCIPYFIFFYRGESKSCHRCLQHVGTGFFCQAAFDG